MKAREVLYRFRGLELMYVVKNTGEVVCRYSFQDPTELFRVRELILTLVKLSLA